MAGPDDPYNCFVGLPVTVPGRAGAMTVAVKDNFDMAGLPTGAGLGHPGPVAATDAAAVRRLRQAGFTLVGKTMMDEAAIGGTGRNPHHGRTENPRTPGYSPGGSSGGSAAAVASGRCDAALGTDTLGSARIPASYCGIVGFKPSRGLIALDGVVPLSPSLDHVGLLGKTVGVVARLLAVITNAGQPCAPKRHFRIGVPDNLGAVVLDAATQAAFQAALHRMSRHGWTIESCTVDDWDPAPARRKGLLIAEREGAQTHAALLRSTSPALSAEVRRLLEYGLNCCPGRVDQARQVLHQATAGLSRCLQRFDLIAMPTTSSPAFAWADAPPADQADLTALANYGGEPAISIPLPLPPTERATGLQLIGPHGADPLVLHAARAIEAMRLPP